MKAYNWNNKGQLVIAYEVESMDAARELAREYNKDPGPLGQIHLISDTYVQAHATKICAMYPPSIGPLFD